MSYTSPTTINATIGISSVLNYLNEVTEFWFSRMLMIAIFTIVFMAIKKANPNSDDIIGVSAISSFACLVIGLPLWIIGFLDGVTFGIIIAITLITGAILFLDKKK